MPLRQRIATENVDRENLTTRPGKLQPSKLVVPSSRPALGELGNKIHSQQIQTNVVVKKPQVTLIKKEKTEQQKTNKTISVKTGITTTKTEKTIKTETVLTSCIIRHDSILSKHIAKAENDCKTSEEVSYSTKQLVGVYDVDSNDKNDPLLVSEYIVDIFKYLQELENKFTVQPNFLAGHRSTPRMRSVLVNWMVEVHMNFKFLLESLHLSVAIVDRYLQLNKKIGRETLQLVGTTAMFIAGKYEEMFIPDLTDFVYICDDTFTAKQILQMEIHILRKLDFNLGRPLSLHFLRRYNKIARVQPEHHTLGKYLLELALFEYELCHVNPSLQAAAACCLSLGILNNTACSSTWSKLLVHHSGYTYEDIKPFVIEFACAIEKAETSKYKVIRNKYAASNYGKISLNHKLKGPIVKKLLEQAKIKV